MRRHPPALVLIAVGVVWGCVDAVSWWLDRKVLSILSGHQK